ncbi:MAG: DUF2007 domain-containing protein [Anaerolineae bacterium]|nr:DUF2007 domain-containing protein [Anaerolineae bacterium]MCB0177754.1 DUF2007 domain-containing protein [Anaerolineae bacterium]MCB0224067.1 DUF2007 domain-containing protein [Anaerolineae bacterium]MCB9107141.1 DUF2007 domain-containing protein [Anaerolineales bacterium]
MTGLLGNILPWPNAKRQEKAGTADTTKGGSEFTTWVTIAENLNPGEAIVIKGRLESEAIPVVLQQEAVGSVLGLTVGPLGSAKISVPEPLADRALSLLAETFDTDDGELGDEGLNS